MSAWCRVTRCSCVRHALSVVTSFLWTVGIECMLAREKTTSHSCALATLGRSVGVDGGHQKKWSTWLRCRHVDHMNTRVTRCALLCDAPLAPRCVHVTECLRGAV